MTATSLSPGHREGMRQRLRVLEEELQAGSVPANRIAHHLADVIAELESDLAREAQAPDPPPTLGAPVAAALPQSSAVPPVAARPMRLWPAGLALAAAATAIGVLAFPVSDRSAPPAFSETDDELAILRERTWPPEAVRLLRDLTIQSNGRFESLEQFSRQMLLLITGAEQLGAKDSVQTVLSMVANPQRWRQTRIILIEPSVADLLDVPEGAQRASWSELMTNERLSRRVMAAARKQRQHKPLTPAERDVLVVAARCARLEDLFEQHLHLVSPALPPQQTWAPILAPDDYPAEQQIGVKRSWSGLLAALRRGHPERITEAAAGMRRLLNNLHQPADFRGHPQALAFFRD